MPMLNLKVVTAAALAAFVLPALAQTDRQRIDQRQLEQERRIEEGVKSGQINATEAKRLRDNQERIRRMEAEALADGKLSPQDMSGGTFSVSNLGMFGVESFSAVINPPEAAILAVGAMQQEPVVRDGEIVARHTIALELSVDHRAVDGAVGAAFLKDLAEVLESPMRIVL